MNHDTTIEIDGSHGEGGGQVLRTALSMSLISGRTVRVRSVRGRRRKPGVLRQHLTGLRAAAAVGGLEGGQDGLPTVEGDEIGSSTVTFRPAAEGARPGNYRFAVGTAGSAVLVTQTVLPALLLADKPSTITVEGGTHADWAPCFDFFEKVFLRQVRAIGFNVNARLERYGFFPAGGGRMVTHVAPPNGALRKLELLERGSRVNSTSRVVAARLPRRIAEREVNTLQQKLNWAEEQHVIEETSNCVSPGNAVMVEVESEHVTELFAAFGKHGRSAEKVANDAARQVKSYLKSTAPAGAFLADQLLLPMVLSGGGRFLTSSMTQHTRTNIDIIECFGVASFEVAFNGSQAQVDVHRVA